MRRRVRRSRLRRARAPEPWVDVARRYPTSGRITDWSYEDGVTTVEEVRMSCEHEASLGFPVTFVSP